MNLTENYICTSSDSSYKNGILIDKSIAINGNGFTLDGKSHESTYAAVTSNTTLTFNSTEIQYGTTDSIVATLKDETNSPVVNVNVKLVVGNLSVVAKTNQKGQVSLNISDLKPGEYNMAARSAATGVYNGAKANAKLTIISNTTFKIPKVNVKYGDKGIVVATLKDARGNPVSGVKVKLVVGNLTQITRTDENGQVSLDISSLKPGDYKIGARSASTCAYNEVKGYSTASIYKNRVNPTLTIPNVAADYGNGVAVATLKDARGNPVSGVKVKLVVGNLTQIARTDENGQVSLDISGFEPGVYRIAARSASTSLFNEVKVYAKATISINTKFTVHDTTADTLSIFTVVTTLKDARGKPVFGVKLNLTFGDITVYRKSDASGQASFEGGGFEPGLYNFTVKSSPTDIYHAAEGHAKVTITSPTTLTIPDVNVKQGSGVVVATLKDVRGNPVSGVKVKLVVGNLTQIARTDENGQVSLDISGFEPGVYRIAARSASTSLFNEVKVYAKATISINTKFTVHDTTADTLSIFTVVTTLKDARGKPVFGVKLNLTFGDITVYRKSDASGQASFEGGGFEPGLYNFTVKSSPTDIYHAAEGHAKVTITSPTTLTIPDVNVKQGSGVVVATLKDVRGNPVSGVKVKLAVADLTKTTKTNNDGQVSLDISSLKPGEYQITAESVATKIYYKSTNYAKAVVS